APQDGAEGEAHIVERLRPGIQRADDIDQHELPIERTETALEERPDELDLVALETVAHRRSDSPPPNIRAREGERAEAKCRNVDAAVAWPQETAWLHETEGQRRLAARFEVGRIGEARRLEHVFVRRRIRRDRAPVSCHRRARSALRQPESGGRPRL